jgi:hypothetical protein
MRVRNTRRSTTTSTTIDTSLANAATRRSQGINLTSENRISDSDFSDGDFEAQKKNLSPASSLQAKGEVDLYSPYYSPLETRKKMNMMFKVQEPEEFGGRAGGKSWIDFWKGSFFVVLVELNVTY